MLSAFEGFLLCLKKIQFLLYFLAETFVINSVGSRDNL